jgi:integrase
MIAFNPVTGTRVPKVGAPVVELHPFSEEQLEAFWTAASARNPRLGNILLVAGWTGLRWSELRAISVRDFVEVPMPLLVVQRAAPEGSKSRRPRAVTAGEFLWPIGSFHLSRTWRGGEMATSFCS